MERNPREKLSVILIVKNEEFRIRPCLEALRWVDEIVILDCGSTDKTVAVCKEYTERVIATDWPGYGIQKQRALEAASHPWVLSLDADEVLSPPLQEEIQKTLENPLHDGYFLRLQMVFLQQPMRFGGWAADWKLRLVRKNLAHFTPDVVHESLILRGTTNRLKHPVWHASYPDLPYLARKTDLYSDLSAQKMLAKGRSGGAFKGTIMALTFFLKTYLFRLALLDGSKGLILTFYGAWQVFLKYTKLGLLQQKTIAEQRVITKS